MALDDGEFGPLSSEEGISLRIGLALPGDYRDRRVFEGCLIISFNY